MKAHLTLSFALLLVCSGAALAQTPDGMPPALETVCDLEKGSAYGHCNAYCEAMDCELANDGDPLTEPSASANACSKVRTDARRSIRTIFEAGTASMRPGSASAGLSLPPFFDRATNPQDKEIP